MFKFHHKEILPQIEWLPHKRNENVISQKFPNSFQMFSTSLELTMLNKDDVKDFRESRKKKTKKVFNITF
jgi:hypothetical protein